MLKTPALIPEVHFRLLTEGGPPREVVLRAGDLIGWHRLAQLRLNTEAEIAELHAYISLRERHLTLLPLRGEVRMWDSLADKPLWTPVESLKLAPGQEVALGSGVHLLVDDVQVPDRLLAIEDLDGPDPRPLPGPECAVVFHPGPTLLDGHPAGAAARLWVDEEGVTVEVSGQRPRPWRPGEKLRIQVGHIDRTLRLGWIDLDTGGTVRTHRGERVHLNLETKGEVGIRVERAGRTVAQARVEGEGARLLRALYQRWQKGDTEVSRNQLIIELYQKPLGPQKEERFKAVTKRLRHSLEIQGMPVPLIGSDGRGNWWLDLGSSEVPPGAGLRGGTPDHRTG
jgi:hypothetical protein